MKVIFLAGGCFWGVEKYLSLINGVVETDVGYANGNTQNPSYDDVCYHNTGHAETVRVVYDETVISLSSLLSLFYNIIDPTSINHQGGDVGAQYRTGIYYENHEDKAVITQSIHTLQQNYEKPIAIEILPIKNYYIAEEYHQKYLEKNPNGYCHIGKKQFDKARKAN